MISKKSINEEIDQSNTLSDITRVFAEIASLKMRKVRQSVMTSRDFQSSIYQVFQEVLYSYKQELEEVMRSKRADKRGITFLAHNGRKVVVLISVNANLYGKAVNDAFNKFMEEVVDKDVEATIIGNYGLSLFKQAQPGRPYTFFKLPEEGIDPVVMGKILRHLVQYDEVRFVYPYFKSLANQESQVLILNSKSMLRDDKLVNKNRYLFEPNVLSVMQFFESEIFASQFEQTLRESQLAKFASRMIAMQQASENIKDHLKKLHLSKLKIHHLTSNKQQLQTLPVLLRFSNQIK